MVIQDPNRPPFRPPSPSSPPPKKEKPMRRLSLLGVQCIACGVLVALVLLLRAAGGGPYEQLRRTFRDCMMRNDLMATLAALWDGDPLEALPAEETEENTHA